MSDGTPRQRVLGRLRYQPLFERLHHYALRGLNYGVGSGFAVTGEPHLLHMVGQGLPGPHVVYDVGAHVGDYAALSAAELPGARIVSVEPSASCVDALRLRFPQSGPVEVVHSALGATTGVGSLYFEEAGSSQSSMFARATFDPSRQEAAQVPLTTLDALAASLGDRRISLLKLDVEGSELEVLRGGSRMLSEGAVDVVQFEFGGTNLDARTCLRDFFDLLGDGFVMHRLLSDGLRRLDVWSERWEIYTMNHYVAVRRGVAL